MAAQSVVRIGEVSYCGSQGLCLCQLSFVKPKHGTASTLAYSSNVYLLNVLLPFLSCRSSESESLKSSSSFPSVNACAAALNSDTS